MRKEMLNLYEEKWPSSFLSHRLFVIYPPKKTAPVPDEPADSTIKYFFTSRFQTSNKVIVVTAS